MAFKMFMFKNEIENKFLCNSYVTEYLLIRFTMLYKHVQGNVIRQLKRKKKHRNG